MRSGAFGFGPIPGLACPLCRGTDMREKGSSNYHTTDDSYEIDEIECRDCGTSFKNHDIYEILKGEK